MKEKPKKVRVNFKRLIILILFLYVLFSAFFQIINTPIKNIYIKGNSILTDQEIIEIAKLSAYPSSVTTLCMQVEKRLEASTYIRTSKVTKSWLTTINISVRENEPIFFDKIKNKTVLQDGISVSKRFSVGTLINFTPDLVYEKLIDKMAKVNKDVISRMSEIEYKPNDVDQERFLIAMNDGNYVYVNIDKFTAINDYLTIAKRFNNMKGILYLDSGEYFQVIEN